MLEGLVIGGVSVLIGADATGLMKGANASEARMKQLEKTTSTVVNRMKNAFIALAGPAAIGALIKSTMDVVGAQYDLSKQLGSTVAAIQVLTRAGSLAGLSADDMAGAMTRLNRKLGEAQRDSLSPAADAFKKIGLNAKELANLDADERIGKIATALKAAGYNAQQTADWLGQIGIRGGKMINLFMDGPKGLAEARQELEKIGVLLSNPEAAMIDAAGDSLSIFSVLLQGVGNQLTKAASVLIPKVTDAVKQWATEGEGVGKTFEKIIDDFVVGFGVIPHMIYNVRIAWDMLMDFMVGSLNIFSSAWNATLGKFSFPLEQIENRWGKLSKTLEVPPDITKVREMWQQMKKDALEAADANDKALKMGTGGDTSGVSSKERKALDEKLDALKQSVAAEDEVLRLHRDKQLKDLQEYVSKGIATEQQGNELRAAINKDFNDKMDKLKGQKFENDLMSENELLAKRHQEQLDLLTDFQNRQTYTVEQAEAIRAGIEEKYRQKRLSNMASDWSGIASIVDTAMGAISDIMEDESEKGFTVMKAISMATALVKGFEAAVNAYTFGTRVGGPAVGAVMAGVAAAGTAAIIAKMAGVGPKSKGSPSAGSGGGGAGAAEAAVDQPVPQQPTSLFIRGLNKKELFDGEAVRDLIGKINTTIRDGGQVILSNQ